MIRQDHRGVVEPALRRHDPNLTPFTSRGGKLILYQGRAEPGIPLGHVVNYYNQARTKTSNSDRTRPLCSYPQMAMYKGTASIDEAAHFRCAVPK